MGDFSNRAYLFWGGNVTASNVVRGTLLPRVSVFKSAVEPHYEICGKVTYVISIVNGTGAPKTVTLSDDLGGAGGVSPLSYIDGTAAIFIGGVRRQIVPEVTSPVLIFGGIIVPAGATAVVVYQARVSSCAGDAITNTATVTGDGIERPLVAAHTITRGEATRKCANEKKYTYSLRDTKCDD